MLRATAILLIVIGANGCAASNGTAPASPSGARGSSDAWFRSLPHDVRISDVNPGRFASTVEQEGMNSCSQSWAFGSSRATVVLNLAADGSASGCRGRRYDRSEGSNALSGAKDGTSLPPHLTKSVEQQGMRGRWRRDGRSIVVDSDLDAGVCPARAEGTTPEPWHLRCAAVEVTGPRATVRGPLLVCGWRDDSATSSKPSVNWDSPEGFTTQQLISGFWMVLGAGAGVRLTELGPDGGLDGPTTVSWVPATTPIPFDDWAAKRR